VQRTPFAGSCATKPGRCDRPARGILEPAKTVASRIKHQCLSMTAGRKRACSARVLTGSAGDGFSVFDRKVEWRPAR